MNDNSDEDDFMFVTITPEKRSASPDQLNSRPVKRVHENITKPPNDAASPDPESGDAAASDDGSARNASSSNDDEPARHGVHVPEPTAPEPPATDDTTRSVGNEPSFSCPICLDDHPNDNALALGVCAHKFCRTCMTKYLVGIATETRRIPIKCPACGDALDDQLCVEALEGNPARDALSRLLVERSLGDVRYCSNPTCATPFDYDGAGADNARVDCPLCGTATCADCSAAWHAGVPCALARAGGELAQLARDNDWRNCPSCAELIERVSGCNFMRCRCGAGFCYQCGKAYLCDANRNGMGNGHGVPNCECDLYPHRARRRNNARARLRAAVRAQAPRANNDVLRARVAYFNDRLAGAEARIAAVADARNARVAAVNANEAAVAAARNEVGYEYAAVAAARAAAADARAAAADARAAAVVNVAGRRAPGEARRVVFWPMPHQAMMRRVPAHGQNLDWYGNEMERFQYYRERHRRERARAQKATPPAPLVPPVLPEPPARNGAAAPVPPMPHMPPMPPMPRQLAPIPPMPRQQQPIPPLPLPDARPLTLYEELLELHADDDDEYVDAIAQVLDRRERGRGAGPSRRGGVQSLPGSPVLPEDGGRGAAGSSAAHQVRDQMLHAQLGLPPPLRAVTHYSNRGMPAGGRIVDESFGEIVDELVNQHDRGRMPIRRHPQGNEEARRDAGRSRRLAQSVRRVDENNNGEATEVIVIDD